MADILFVNRNRAAGSPHITVSVPVSTHALIQAAYHEKPVSVSGACFPRRQPTLSTSNETAADSHAAKDGRPTEESRAANQTSIESVGTCYELIQAVRWHVSGLFDKAPFLACGVIITDNRGQVVDLMGPPDIISQLEALGVTRSDSNLPPCVATQSIARALSTHAPATHFSEQDGNLCSATCLVTDQSQQILGSISFVRFNGGSDPLLPVVHSTALAVSHYLALNDKHKDAVRVHQSLLSHLDYHVIRIHVDGSVESHHPIPLVDDQRDKMIDCVQTAPDGDSEFFVEDKLYSCNLRNLTDALAGNMGRLAVLRDITHQRQMESRVRDADKLSVLASLAAGIAHEIRNPLTTAKGFLQLFAERQSENSDGRYIDLTIQELDRIQDLVKDFMSLARPVQPEYETVELNTVIRDVWHFMQPEALLHDVTIQSDVPNDDIYIRADRNQVKQVLMNVLQNALQACTANGKIFVDTATRSASVTISIRDTGCGLSIDQLTKAFQPFFTTKSAGTGLGLVVCRQIMQEHGGSIEMSSKLGQGTVVRLVFPLAQVCPSEAESLPE